MKGNSATGGKVDWKTAVEQRRGGYSIRLAYYVIIWSLRRRLEESQRREISNDR